MDTPLDRELEDLPPELRWRTWIGRIEAVLFASATPVSREALQNVVGQGASVDLLIEDLQVELADRAFEIASVADAWTLRTRAGFADAIRAAADLGDRGMEFTRYEMAVLATIAYHQPISRAELKDVFGKDINRDLIGRLYAKDLIATGPRSPKRGAPYTYVTTKAFLLAFDLQSLRDLPDMEQLQDAGLMGEDV
ncbi:MAG: SMC-Scp complex subunit ScpB [Rhodobacteraceae bacterium]|nr:SMC-Scp complex subunit ScpB [Paracoccaceae bacterium]